MFDLPGPLGTLVNFLTIALGFGSIIFIHELGHFVAAKWAGIRVLAFSIGFGNVVCSYRKGLGFRKGSSDAEYAKLIRDAQGTKGDTREDAQAKLSGEISPTEYRFSMLPLGGYVKMLGQEDLNPEATSSAADSYQNCPVGKRMVVICAGVVMNMIMAGLLFITVFMVGLKSLPPVIGFVPDGSPAATAISSDSQIVGGLTRGDTILSINDKIVYSFEDVLPEIAMAPKGIPASIMIQRQGHEQPIEFLATPTKNATSGLLDIGISPSISTALRTADDPDSRRVWDLASREYGMAGLEPGDVFVAVNNQPIHSPFDILDIAEQTSGEPITASIKRDEQLFDHVIDSVPAMQVGRVPMGDDLQAIRHLLGLTGVLMVEPSASPEDTKQGLEPGDIFARLANTQYPSVAEGISIIRNHAGKSLDLVVLRIDDQGIEQRVKLSVDVSQSGTIGFYQASSTTKSNIISEPAKFSRAVESDSESDAEAPKTELVSFPASDLIEYPGSRITAIGEYPTSTLRDIHVGLLIAIDSAHQAGDESFSVPVTIELPLPTQPDGAIPTTVSQWELTRADIDSVRELGWSLPGSLAMVNMFEYAQIIDKADSPLEAINRGMSKSRRVMMQTYITFLRLFEGSVQVKHLKGPVGIAHLGTQIASQGWVWVLFFMALISVNLAVINFLPLPIVDGGQFLMLVYEWIRGKPVPILFQNITTLAGLAIIGTIFLYVTLNDIKSIFGL